MAALARLQLLRSVHLAVPIGLRTSSRCWLQMHVAERHGSGKS